MGPSIAQKFEHLEKLQQLACSVATKPDHRIIFHTLYEYYNQCFETDPDKKEPKPSLIFEKLQNLKKNISKVSDVQDVIDNQSKEKFPSPQEFIQAGNSPEASSRTTRYIANQDSGQEELAIHNPLKGKRIIKLVSEQGTSSFGKPPTIAKAEIYSQTFLLEEKEELNIDSLTDEITNGSFANNEAKAKIESTSISTYLPPPMILRPIEDVHSPKSEVAGDQVIRSAWPSRQINIHSALSGLNFEKQKAKTEQGFIIQPENEQRQSRSLKRQRFKTDAYETTSTTLSINLGLSEEYVKKLENFRGIAFSKRDIEIARDNCKYIIEKSYLMLGKIDISMEDNLEVKNLRPKEMLKKLKSDEILSIPKSDMILNSNLIDFELLKSRLSTPISSTELIAVILRPSAEIGVSSYAHLKEIIQEVSLLMESKDIEYNADNLLNNININSENIAFEFAYEQIVNILGGNPFSFAGLTLSNRYHYICGPGIRRLVDYFTHCIHGLFVLWRAKNPDFDCKKMSKSAVKADICNQQRSLYCLSNFLLIGPRAIFTANSTDTHKQTRWHSLARLDLTCSIIKEQVKFGSRSLYWGPLGNLRYKFIELARAFIEETVDWRSMLRRWLYFIDPYVLLHAMRYDLEILLNPNAGERGFFF